MSKYFCTILNDINDLNLQKKIPQMILNQGKTLFNKKVVTDIKISAREVTGSVKETHPYAVAIKLDESGSLKMTCECEEKPFCQHETALVFHLKMNLKAFDDDFCDAVLKSSDDPFNRLLVYLKRLSEYSVNFFGNKIDNCQMLNDGMVSSFRGMVESGHNMTYVLFYHLFFNYNLFQLGRAYHDKTWQDLNELFLSLLFKATAADFDRYSPQYANINFEQISEFLKRAGEKVDDKGKERNLVAFIDIVNRQISTNELINDATQKKMEETLLSIKAKAIEKYEDDDTYLNFLKSVASVSDTLESRYLFALYRLQKYDDIFGYGEETDHISLVAQLLRHVILFDQQKESSAEFAKGILKAFRDQASYENFLIIKKTVNEECFELLKNDLLKYARKYDLSDYLEMEISMNPEKGYQLAKAEGVLEFNRHVNHFIGNKDEDMIYFYQEQLVPILSKIKSYSKRFSECISALEALKEMNGGKYIIFTIYRLACLENSDNEFIHYELSSYVNQLDL